VGGLDSSNSVNHHGLVKTILDFRVLIKDGEFLEKLKHCQLFKKESANEVHQSTSRHSSVQYRTHQ